MRALWLCAVALLQLAAALPGGSAPVSTSQSRGAGAERALPECAPQHARLPALRALTPACASCALLLFRHVQKTGGSTLRNFFRRQEATGDWEFYR
jgi:hypothetical protein